MSNLPFDLDPQKPFQGISQLNQMMGHHAFSEIDADCIKAINNSVFYLKSEIEETCDAISDNDLKEIMDGYGDIITVLGGINNFTGNKLIESECLEPETDYIQEDDVLDTLELLYGMLTLNTMLDTSTQYFSEDSLEQLKPLVVFLVDQANNIPINYDFDPYEVVHRVTISNFSKVCWTQEDRDYTLDYYQDLGVEVHSVEYEVDNIPYYIVYSSKKQIVKGKEYGENKFLKNQNKFQEPDFSDLIN